MRVRPAMKRESCSRFGGAGAPAPTRDGGQRSHARSIRGYQGGLPWLTCYIRTNREQIPACPRARELCPAKSTVILALLELYAKTTDQSHAGTQWS